MPDILPAETTLIPGLAEWVSVQADATRGERSKTTIADVIERANGELSLKP